MTKTLQPVVAELHRRGVTCIIYIDDLLLIADSKRQAERDRDLVLKLFKTYGLQVNLGKSELEPSQRREFLGVIFDSTSMTVAVAPHRRLAFKRNAKRLLKRGCASARHTAQLLGQLSSMAEALFPVRVHTTYIHQHKLRCLSRGGWDTILQLSATARQEIKWWIHHLRLMNGRSVLPVKTDMTMDTDACDTGWGAALYSNSGRMDVHSQFSTQQQQHHINAKEMLAVLFALKHYSHLLSNKSINIRTDNITTMFYVNRM